MSRVESIFIIALIAILVAIAAITFIYGSTDQKIAFLGCVIVGLLMGMIRR